ncbi:dTMP kinase [Gammaproteobacteria bacterium]|nr:dTMP kinase [Gammaproteobacteria bacterium]MDC3313493.1 dTMP kinase [Gammaproteobacteria bacterium]MDC3368272.1 dTMP kinase [Gammaproteobacteria bacterium]
MKIISFEGIEGVGKSTQIKMLDEHLKSKGLSTEILREPGSTVIGEKIRDILLNSDEDLSSETELLLMFSARAQLIKEKIINSSNDFILFDRFFDASSAYQGYGRGLSLKLINNLIEFTKCPIPDITFLLDISVDEGFKRKTNDTKDRIESSGNTFFENVRQGYLDLSKNNNRIKVLDAQKPINDLHQEIVTITNQYI